MSDTDGKDWLIPSVIAVSVLLEFVVVILMCLFRRRSREQGVSDENSLLLAGGTRNSGTDFSTTQLGFNHAYMSAQYYIRGLKRLDYLQSYKQTNAQQHTYWFSLKDGELARRKNKDRLLPLSNGNCVLKAKLQPKLSAFIKNRVDNTLNIALDVLLTIEGDSCPYIFPLFDLKYQSDRETLLILNEFMPYGSLRDQMLGAKAFHHLTRTAKAKKVDYGKPLSVQKICSFIKQILMGLIFLDKLGYPLKKTHLWLHCGNLMAHQGVCQLTGYEVELLQMKEDEHSTSNEDRAGLNSVGQIVFEMVTGFPINYADNTALDPSKRRLTLKRKEKLRELHFEYLKMISKPEVVQIVKFLCDEDKCASLHVSIHHPFFDQVTRFQPVEPDNATTTSVKTLLRSISKGTKSRKRKAASDAVDDERDCQFGYSSPV